MLEENDKRRFGTRERGEHTQCFWLINLNTFLLEKKIKNDSIK